MATIDNFYKEFPNNKALGITKQGENNMLEVNGKVQARKQKTTQKGEPYYVLGVNNDFFYLFQNKSVEGYRHVQEDIAVGDFVDLKAKKSGDFYHITDIMKVQQDTIPEPTEPDEPAAQAPAPATKQAPKKEFVTEREKFDFNITKQGAIIAQSTLRDAITTVGLYDRTGMSAEKIDEEIKRVWRQYYKDVMKTLDE